MFETFSYAWNVIAPILAMIAAGFAARRLLPMDEKFYKQLNALCFRVFLPMNLFCSVYKITGLSSVRWPVLLFAAGGVLLAAALGFIVIQFIPEREQKGVLVQATFRSNSTIIGLYLASALGGAAAEAFASVVLAVTVCIYNVLAVVVLEYYAGTKKRTFSETCASLLKNPLLNAILAGFAVLILRAVEKALFGDLPVTLQNTFAFLYKALTDFSKVASPLMIFALGAQLDFSDVHGKLGRLVLGCSMRLLVVPAVCLGLAAALRSPLQLTSVEVPALIAVFATPAALSGSVMVSEIGGDSRLTSQIIVCTTAFSMLTLFAIICIFRGIGLL